MAMILPNGWFLVKIAELADFSRGISWRKSEANTSGNGIPVISIPNIRNSKTIDWNCKYYLTKKVNDNYFLHVNDIIFVGSSGSVHNVGRNVFIKNIPHERVAFASFTFRGRPDLQKINAEFFYFAIVSTWINFAKFARRAADGKFNFQLTQFVREQEVPLPPFFEQEKIAFILSKIQSAIETQEKIIKTATELKKALMEKLFTEGLRNEPQKDTEIGKVPRSWEVVKIDELILETATQNPTKNPNGVIKYIDVSSVSNENFSVVGYQNFLGKNAPGRARKVVLTNDVIFATIRPTLRRIAKIEMEYNNEYCSTAFCVLRSNPDKLDFEFLYQYLLTDYFINEIGKFQSGASYPAVRDEDVKRMKIPLPNFDEQKEISSILKSLDTKILTVRNKQKKLEQLFQSILHQLMTEQTRVKDINL